MDTNKISPELQSLFKKFAEEEFSPALIKFISKATKDKLEKAQEKPSLLNRLGKLQKRYSEGGILDLAVDAYKKRKAKTTVEQTTTGDVLKTADKPAQPAEPVPTTNLTVAEPLKTGEPAQASNKEEKHLIKGEGNVVLIGGITTHGVEDLTRKLPKVLKPILKDLYEHIGVKVSNEKKPEETTTSGGGTGGGGILGAIWDFFKGKGGKKIAVKEAEELAAKEGSKLATKAVEKTVAKEGTEIAAKEGGKVLAKEGTEIAAKEGGKVLAKEGTEIAAKEGGKLVAEEGAKVGGKVLAKEGAKIGGKALGKSVLKKIPGLGLVAGLGFGAQRAWHGDWLGAAGEVASGAASTIPGIGTAASLGIDAALAGRDIYKASKGEGEGGPTPAPTTTAAPIPETPTAVTPPPAILPATPSVQPTPPVTAPAPVAATGTDNSDVLSDISDNTSKTNDLLTSLTQAIMKLAQNTGGNINTTKNVVMNNNQQPSMPSASEIMANNVDPIRAVRAKYAY
jgi:hypothetical protein